MASRVRLSDVARTVGVSTKTVSNVVNNTGWVSDAVRQQVRVAIDELGYRPNLAARQLRGGQSGLIALCIPTLSEPYFAELASQLVDAAQPRGSTILVTQSKGDRRVEMAMLEGDGLPALDGLILSPLALTADDIATRQSTVPLVLIGEHGESLATDTVTHIGPDNVGAARAATQHLIAGGRRRIAAIGLQDRIADTAQLRFSGYQHALEEASLPVDPDLLVRVGRYNRSEGSQAIEQLLDRGVDFDAVFCFNDSLAFGALHTLASRGLSVPGDVDVIGYDNIEECQYVNPPLKSVDPGVAAASDLILNTLLTADHPRGGHVEVPFAIVDYDED